MPHCYRCYNHLSCLDALLTSVGLLCSVLVSPSCLMWLLSLSCLDSAPHARPWGFDSLARLVPCGVVRAQKLALKNPALHHLPFLPLPCFHSGLWYPASHIPPMQISLSSTQALMLCSVPPKCSLNPGITTPISYRCLLHSDLLKGFRTELFKMGRIGRGKVILLIIWPCLSAWSPSALPIQIFCDSMLRWWQTLSSTLVIVLCPPSLALPLVAVLASVSCLCVHTCYPSSWCNAHFTGFLESSVLGCVICRASALTVSWALLQRLPQWLAPCLLPISLCFSSSPWSFINSSLWNIGILCKLYASFGVKRSV